MYRVLIDDNFLCADESERTVEGDFDTLEAAIAACRKIVEDSLDHFYKPGMTAATLYSHYTAFGDDPFVEVPLGDPLSNFSAWDYAKQRASEMCEAPDAPPLAPAE